MTETQDRRARGVNRVNVARLVDICGRDPSVPAFEAESVELSGRGMHVRTPFLPPLGAPLVCRLEDGGKEIVVEGVVAWQRDRDGGGEFGVQFTALDSGSVEALKHLCGLEARDSSPEVAPAAPARAAAAEPAAPAAPTGMPVKLHIDGLGAPMKARVRNGGTRKLQVGSNLEFLKVGRGLEIEDVEQGERRGARIDAVSIAIDPQTQVPQLVVALRYDGEDTTPEPSVIGEEEAALAASPQAKPLEAMKVSEPASTPDIDDDDDDDDVSASAGEMRGKVDAFAESLGRAAKRTSDKLGVVGESAAEGITKWAKLGGSRLAALAARRTAVAAKRTTAKAPAAATPSGQRRLRPQNAGSDAADDVAGMSKQKKLVMAASAGAILSLGIAAALLSGHSSKSDASAAATTAVAAPALPPLGAAPSAASTFAAPPAMAAAPNAFGAQQGPGSPMPGAAMANTMPGAPAPGAAMQGQRPGVVANVPLFGPTPMATLEPAPLGPSPDELATPPANVATRATEERMEEDEPKSTAHDESFDDGTSKKDDKQKSAEAKAEAVKPWSDGKLHLPLVHRLKLDHPGTAIEGKKESTGFSVVLPGRKVTDSAAAISKRDDRIADVRTKNGPNGAKITFVFRSKVPGYKVRLRKSYVEFFISSPDGAK
jgi:hypothetical protein